MQNLRIILFSLLISLTFVACSSGDDNTPNKDNQETTTPAETTVTATGASDSEVNEALDSIVDLKENDPEACEFYITIPTTKPTEGVLNLESADLGNMTIGDKITLIFNKTKATDQTFIVIAPKGWEVEYDTNIILTKVDDNVSTPMISSVMYTWFDEEDPYEEIYTYTYDELDRVISTKLEDIHDDYSDVSIDTFEYGDNYIIEKRFDEGDDEYWEMIRYDLNELGYVTTSTEERSETRVYTFEYDKNSYATTILYKNDVHVKMTVDADGNIVDRGNDYGVFIDTFDTANFNNYNLDINTLIYAGDGFKGTAIWEGALATHKLMGQTSTNLLKERVIDYGDLWSGYLSFDYEFNDAGLVNSVSAYDKNKKIDYIVTISYKLK